MDEIDRLILQRELIEGVDDLPLNFCARPIPRHEVSEAVVRRAFATRKYNCLYARSWFYVHFVLNMCR